MRTGFNINNFKEKTIMTENSNMVMPVSPCGNGGGLFGNDQNGWWIILLFIILGGWGNRGFGGYGYEGGSSISENYTLISDFSQLSKQISDQTLLNDRKFDAITNGICNLGYTQQTLANNNAVANMQGFNAVQSQMAQCCCDVREAISGVNYNAAMNTNTLNQAINNGFCQTNFNNSNNTRDIITSTHGDTDRIIARLDAMENARQAEKIAELQSENQGLRFSASQQAQSAYLISQLGYQCPKPAYVVQPPQPVSFNNNGCGYSCGCNG